jgi:hypothetical protein
LWQVGAGHAKQIVSGSNNHPEEVPVAKIVCQSRPIPLITSMPSAKFLNWSPLLSVHSYIRYNRDFEFRGSDHWHGRSIPRVCTWLEYFPELHQFAARSPPFQLHVSVLSNH